MAGVLKSDIGRHPPGEGKVFEKPYVKRMKAPVGSMPKAHTQLLKRALAFGVHNFDWGRPGGVYTGLVRNARMEILVEGRTGLYCLFRELGNPTTN
jgi:hypothetical protein